MRVGDADYADRRQVRGRVEGVSSEEEEETIKMGDEEAEEGEGDGNDVEGEGLKVCEEVV